MKNKIIFLCLAGLLLILNAPSWAEMILLKNGTKVEGKIVEKTDQQIKVDVRGITLTYFPDEIDRIEGQSGQPAVAQPEKIFSAQPTTDSQTNSFGNKQQLIWKLIEVSGTKANMDNIFNDMLSKASADEAEKIQELFNIDEIVLQLIPIYDKYFDQDELQQLVDFYNSKGGQKLLAVTPMITQESMDTTLQYFQDKMQTQNPSQ